MYGLVELQWPTEMLFMECLPSGHMLARLKLGKLDGVSRLQTMVSLHLGYIGLLVVSVSYCVILKKKSAGEAKFDQLALGLV